jgi:hypothetical protein
MENQDASATTTLAGPALLRGFLTGIRSWPASCLALIVANLLPLAGVLFFGWSVFAVMFWCWMENVLTGAFNVLRMAAARGTIVPKSVNLPTDQVPPFLNPAAMGNLSALAKLFFIPFFIIHYGIFTLVHGVFIFALFGGGQLTPTGPGSFTIDHPFQNLHNVLPEGIFIVLLGMIASHGISFVKNFIQNGEYRQANVQQLMMQPYSRVVVLHLTIILGGAAVMITGSNQAAVAALVLFKIVVDLFAHISERRKFAGG